MGKFLSVNHIHKPVTKQGNKRPLFGHKLLRIFLWWFGFSSFYAMTSGVCPCCGRPGCPVGAGLAGIMGGVVTLFMQNWKHFVKHIRMKLSRGLRQKEKYICV
ncbi:MAG: hypothetical protein ACUVQ4_08245 [bacterium]